MKGNALFFTLVLMLLTLGCISSIGPGGGAVLQTHAPPYVLSESERLALQMKSSDEIKQLFEVKCSLCHSLNRSKSAEKNYDDWVMTVYYMKNHYGALIAEEEVLVIATYINETYGN